jgi:IS4 transposase
MKETAAPPEQTTLDDYEDVGDRGIGSVSATRCSTHSIEESQQSSKRSERTAVYRRRWDIENQFKSIKSFFPGRLRLISGYDSTTSCSQRWSTTFGG